MNDGNIKKISVSQWKYFVKSAIFKEALLQLQVELFSNGKTNHITYQHSSLKPNDYLLQLPSHLARLVFKAKTRMLDIKINYKRKYKNCLHRPFCSEYDETFEHIFKCNLGLRVPKQLKDFTLQSFPMAPSEKLLKKLGYFLDKYNKYRLKGNIIIFGLMSAVMSVLLFFYCSYCSFLLISFFNNLF